MRIAEIEDINREVLATARFRKELAETARLNPQALKVLEEFIDYRRTAPTRNGWGKKDYPFQNGLLKGIWHVHIVFGKDVIIYDITPVAIKLICIVDHGQIDGTMNKGLIKSILGMSDSDFTPFELPNTSSNMGLGNAEKAEIEQLLWELASDKSDRPELEAAVNGNWSEHLREFILHVANIKGSEEQQWQAVIAAFGGEQELARFIKNILSRTIG
jgi:hypothetical protein